MNLVAAIQHAVILELTLQSPSFHLLLNLCQIALVLSRQVSCYVQPHGWQLMLLAQNAISLTEDVQTFLRSDPGEVTNPVDSRAAGKRAVRNPQG